jgi:hypothetical protein
VKVTRGLLLTAVLVVVAFGVGRFSYWYVFDVPRQDIKTPSLVAPKGNARATVPKHDVAAQRRPIPPSQLRDFYHWSSAERLKRITVLQNCFGLSGDVVGFIKTAVQDSTLNDTVRNNMSNILASQEKQDPELYRVFLSIVDDGDSSDISRSNALQHLAQTYGFAAKPEIIEGKLLEFARKRKHVISGTALLQLDLIDGKHRKDLDVNAFACALLADPEAHPASVITALALLGKRGAKSELPLVRLCVRTPGPRRAALATLGLIGGEDDIPLVRSFLYDDNKLTAMAARVALKRLIARRKSRN